MLKWCELRLRHNELVNVNLQIHFRMYVTLNFKRSRGWEFDRDDLAWPLFRRIEIQRWRLNEYLMEKFVLVAEFDRIAG